MRTQRSSEAARRQPHRMRMLFGALGCCALSLAPTHTANAQDPSVEGQWGKVLDWDGLVAVHAVHLPHGYVLVWRNGSNVRIWNAAIEAFVDGADGAAGSFPLDSNIFCAGHAQLPTGWPLVIGGASQNGRGISDSNIFRWPMYGPTHWQTIAPMTYQRWYPTCTVLPDGQILATSGRDINASAVRIPELYDATTNTWRQLIDAEKSLPLYPFMFVAPTGDVFHAGPSLNTSLLDIEQQQWTTIAQSSFAGETAVMYRPGKVMKAGGQVLGVCVGDPKQEDDAVAIANTAVIDLNATAPQWVDVADMSHARRRFDLTLLADGRVLATGGTGCENNQAFAVRAADLFDPATDTWTELASISPEDPPRMYHSVALLLSDARVLIAGCNNQPSAQIFSPPYLFRGPRPEITSAPGMFTYASTELLSTPQAQSIANVNLLRLGSVTHEFDQNQRLVPLAFEVSGATTLTVSAPIDGAVAPPGYYMLFIISDDGVPSMAQYVFLKGRLADINGDGIVNVVDFLYLIGCYGGRADVPCDIADINQDGMVDIVDFLALLGAWG